MMIFTDTALPEFGFLVWSDLGEAEHRFLAEEQGDFCAVCKRKCSASRGTKRAGVSCASRGSSVQPG